MKNSVLIQGGIILFLLLLVAPSLWATDYYVSPSGSDTNPGTSSSTPWRTLYSSVNKLQPGDRLIVMDGRYLVNDYDHIITPPSGQADGWITIEGQEGTKPVLAGGNDLDRMITLSGKSYVHLKNLEITHDDQATGQAMWFRNGIVCDDEGQCSNIILEDLYIHHVDDMGINMQDVNNIQILNSRIEYCAISAIGGPVSNTGYGGWRNAAIKRCSLSYSGHYYQGGNDSRHIYGRPDGMEIPHGSQGPLLVEDTIAQHNYGDGLDPSIANTTIRRCVVANNSCTGVKLWRGDSLVENTLIYGRGDGSPLSDYWSAINIKTAHAGDNFTLINVTVDDYVGTNYLMHAQYDFPSTPINLTIRNCIFRAMGQSTGIFLRNVVTLTAENNLFYMPNWTNEILQHGEEGTVYTSITITSLGTDNLYGDPLFTNPAWGVDGDYRLQAGSPAIDSGSSLDAPAVDLNNYVRNSPVDIGAYEYVGIPVPDIKANSQDGSITVSSGTPVSITVSLDPDNLSGQNADWWVAESAPDGNYYYFDLSTSSMVQGLSPTHQGPLFSLGTTQLLNSSNLTVGTHTFYFGVDLNMNGSLDMNSIYYDWVNVNVTNQ